MNSRLKTCTLAAALFLVNFYICHELFRIEYLRHMGSIEGAFIGIARYAMAHWRDLQWFPLWYDGIPYQNTYPPLLHGIVAAVAVARGISPALAYHGTTALAYCLGPVTVFALALRLARSRWAAFLAGAFYSTVSISAVLLPSVRGDVGSVFHPRRLQAMVLYGEGPHILAMTLLPLAILFLDWALERRRAPQVALAAVTMAAVALTNWLGAFALALMVMAYMVARFEGKTLARDVAFLALISAAAYGLAAPWIPPSTIALTRFNAQFNGGDFRQSYAHLPVWGGAAIVTILLLKMMTRRLSVGLQFAILLSFLLALIPMAFEWAHVDIVPQPMRYHLETEMAFALLFGLGGQALLRRREGWVGAAMIGVVVLAMIFPVRRERNYARNFLLRDIDIRTTSEWNYAQWLNQHWSGERVLMPGSVSFWLLAFSDVPEANGGFDQGITDPVIPAVLYGVTTGEAMGAHDTEYSVLWLKALGVGAVGVSGEGSTEVYKPFRNPRKFDGVLEPLWRDGGDTIYRVGEPHTSLARVVPASAIVRRPPINALDVDEAKAYVAALEDPAMPRAEFRWTTAHSAQATANVQEGEVLSIQMAYHRGWHAVLDGSVVPIQRDGMGLMVIHPPRAGRVDLELSYDGGAEMRVARWLCGLTFLALLASLTHAILKRSW